MTSEPIPGPRALPFLGNMLDIAGQGPAIFTMERLADTYGPIFQLRMKGRRVIVVSGADLVEELVDEKRFKKAAPRAFDDSEEARGLFTSRSDDPDWGQAHRVLSPAFSPMSIEDMFDDMKDIANQLVLKWARQGPEVPILATDDLTRLTLDTIALCSMDYRFNSFYQEKMHPFVDAMLYVLTELGVRSNQPNFIAALRYSANAKLDESNKLMERICKEIIEKRHENPEDHKPDLLEAMLKGKDPKTGEKMREALIIANMITFLVAGHETTSGLLSFTLYSLLNNSEAYLKAQKEIDDVVGTGPIEAKHLKELKYISACMRESLRLYPTAPAMSKLINPEHSKEPVLLGGKYLIEPEDLMLVILTKSQRDPAVYGEDANEFKPERMLDEEFEKLPSGAWKPFGSGSRSCIGRAFAWQEALLVMAMILQNFNIQLENPSYNLQIQQALTIKPKNLYIKAIPRRNISITKMDQSLHHSTLPTDQSSEKSTTRHVGVNGEKRKLQIYFGSNSGTCQSFAQRLASDSTRLGFEPNISSMDEGVGNLPKQTPIIIITASYEGQPPDNAARFVEWLQTLEENDLEGVEFAVFGAGHKDWAKTFHRVPKLVQYCMKKSGGHEFAPLGLVDVSGGDLYSNLEDWLDKSVWPGLSPAESLAVVSDFDSAAEISTETRSKNLRYDLSMGLVKSNTVLTAPGEPVKNHTEIELPSDMTYECGDYLAVLPLNSDDSIRRVMAQFKLPWDATIKTGEQGLGTIPANMNISIYEVLRSYVETAQPATKSDIAKLLERTDNPKTQTQLQSLVDDAQAFESEILSKRTSILTLLHQHPSINLSFATFLALLPSLRVRQYSISSSPLVHPTSCSITYSVLDQPSLSDTTVPHRGVAGTYLHNLQPGDLTQVAVRKTKKSTFRLPLDAETTPLLMFAAGTGLAPFRGFLEQRAAQISQRSLAPAVLFVGCRSPVRDRLFAAELDEWVQKGVVDVRYAFSKEPASSEGAKYVGDRMLIDKELLRTMWKAGARVYVCGSRAFQETVEKAATKILIEVGKELDCGKGEGADDMARVEDWFKKVADERIAVDIFD